MTARTPAGHTYCTSEIEELLLNSETVTHLKNVMPLHADQAHVCDDLNRSVASQRYTMCPLQWLLCCIGHCNNERK